MTSLRHRTRRNHRCGRSARKTARHELERQYAWSAIFTPDPSESASQPAFRPRNCAVAWLTESSYPDLARSQTSKRANHGFMSSNGAPSMISNFSTCSTVLWIHSQRSGRAPTRLSLAEERVAWCRSIVVTAVAVTMAAVAMTFMMLARFVGMCELTLEIVKNDGLGVCSDNADDGFDAGQA